ncbi:MAG: hypothetical protein KC996_06000 [Phycisphaerales bacterium]|nr:hypothetical protein [Phycisphaerales bacterium]
MPPTDPITPRTTTLARSIARRAGRSEMLNTLGRTLAWALPFVLLAVAAVRYWAHADWWPGIPIATGLVCVLIAGVLTARRWWSLARAAGEADTQLGLKDELRSAIELDPNRGGFAKLAVQASEHRAAELQAGSVRFTLQRTPWIISGIATAIMILVGVWMPQRAPTSPKPSPLAIAQANRTARALDAAAETLDRSSETENPRVREAIDELADLEEELLQDPARADDAPARAAAKLDQLADELDRDADEQDQLRRELADRITEHTNNQSSPLDEFADALSQQDYESAREAMENLREQSEGMSDAEREALREQLEQLANAIEPDNADQPERATEPTRTPDPQEDLDPSAEPPDQPQETDPINDPQSSDKPEPTESDRLSEALREEAERLREQPKQPPVSKEKNKDDPAQNEQDTRNQEPAGSQPESNSTEQNQSPTENTPPEQQNENKEQPGSNEQPTGEKKPQPDPSSSERSEREQEPGQQQPQQTNDGQPQPMEDDPEGSQPSQQSEKQPGDQSKETTTNRRPGGEGNQEQRDSLDEVLREMDEAKQRGEGQRRDAEELRRAARELIEPDQNPSEQHAPGAEDEGNTPSPLGDRPDGNKPTNPPRDPGDQPEYIPVDGRNSDNISDARKAGEWYAPDDPDATPSDRARSAERLRQAAHAAKRAVDAQQVPRKYRDLIRDVYERVEKRADSSQPTGAVTPGKDAQPSGSKP